MLTIFPSLQSVELLCSAVARYVDMMAFPQPEKGLGEFDYRLSGG